jgi:phosphoribosyl 1,2-cyclic phosphodiesterase
MEKMSFSALTSGSSGNAYYIENKKDALLVDAGISAKRIFSAIEKVGGDTKKLKGILLTHEHSDHKIGADVVARKLNIPIYATSGTLNNSFICSDANLIKEIGNDEEFKINGFDIRAIPKNHSAGDPVSFIIGNKRKVVFMTDLGKVCKESAEAINESDFVFLESNHDVKMLEEGPYLPFHKKWILSDKGHLSNLQAALAVLEYGKQELRGVTLAHLSSVNNTSLLAETSFRNIMKERRFNPKVYVSEKNVPTKMLEL